MVLIPDYRGDLNNAQIAKGVWVGRQGRPQQLDEVVGGLLQTLGMAQQMLIRLMELTDLYRQAAAQAAQQLIEHREALRGQTKALSVDAAADSTRLAA